MDLSREPARRIGDRDLAGRATADRSSATDNVELWSPGATAMSDELRDRIATCLACAFSSRQWERSPMPLGDTSDPQSARGIVAQWGPNASILLASRPAHPDPAVRGQLLGCVVGGILDPDLIDAYGLQPFGASRGDGLLAYIGVSPAHQGTRLLSCGPSRYSRLPAAEAERPGHRGRSLAGLLFSSWLMLPDIRRTGRQFVRTRRSIEPILHLLLAHDFAYRGQFRVEFRGEGQERLVYSRRETRPWAPERRS